MKVNVYRCNACKRNFEVNPKNASNMVCPKCGSMNIVFVKTANKKNG